MYNDTLSTPPKKSPAFAGPYQRRPINMKNAERV